VARAGYETVHAHPDVDPHNERGKIMADDQRGLFPVNGLLAEAATRHPTVIENGRPYTDARKLSDQQVKQLIDQQEQRLHWNGTDEEATAFWKNLRATLNFALCFMTRETVAKKRLSAKP
jgi:hypothetical protein